MFIGMWGLPWLSIVFTVVLLFLEALSTDMCVCCFIGETGRTILLVDSKPQPAGWGNVFFWWCETHFLWPWTAFSDRKNLEEPIPTWWHGIQKVFANFFLGVSKVTDFKSRFFISVFFRVQDTTRNVYWGLISMDAARGAQLSCLMLSYALVNLQKTIENCHKKLLLPIFNSMVIWPVVFCKRLPEDTRGYIGGFWLWIFMGGSTNPTVRWCPGPFFDLWCWLGIQ